MSARAAAVVKAAAATALALCLLLNAAPAGAVYASHCSMPCCRQGGAGGGCAGGSCPVDLPAEAGPPASPTEHHPELHEDHAGRQAAHSGHQAAPAEHHAAAVEHHTEEAAPSCHAPAPEAGAESETKAVPETREHEPARAGRQHAGAPHGHHADDATRNAAPTTSVAAAHIASRCPPECGAALNSFTQTRRPRGEGALSQAARPRPPTARVIKRPSLAAVKLPAALRRRRPPRGPPARHTPA